MPTAETLQIKLDHDLAKTLQANAEAQKLGISEFVRHAVRFYLRLCEEMEIRRKYQQGYGEADLTELALEMKDWEEEQVWPEP
jgi:metal-responsive CopG/Arc/MetJ family transcriptional regulator